MALRERFGSKKLRGGAAIAVLFGTVPAKGVSEHVKLPDGRVLAQASIHTDEGDIDLKGYDAIAQQMMDKCVEGAQLAVEGKLKLFAWDSANKRIRNKSFWVDVTKITPWVNNHERG